MILIGQYDSPFVRRVGIALVLYALPFEHQPWSTFRDAEMIRPFNALLRVPTLVLDTGEALAESHCILDYLDSLVGPARSMYPQAQPERYRAMAVAALATGVADKAVSLFYEHRLHAQTSPVWVDRCRRQIADALGVLEGDRAGRNTRYWFGDRIGHADIAVAVAVRFLADAHPGLIDVGRLPALAADAKGLEALDAFQRVSQAFIPPA